MELFIIKEHLANYQIETYGRQNLSLDIQVIKFLTKNQDDFQDRTIYFGSTDLLPPPDTPGEFAILCSGQPPHWPSFQESSFSILFIEDQLDQAQIFNRIQDILQANNLALHKQVLFDALQTDKGLQYLVDVSYEIFGNPLFVIDNSYKYLAISSGVIVNDPFIDGENRKGYISEKGIEFIRKSKLDEKIRKQNSPVLFYNPLHNRNMMVDAITINNVEVGRIMLYELDQSFREFDNILLRQISRIFSMELQKNSFINTNDGLMYSYIFGDLLDNHNTSYVATRERLSLLGYNLKDEQYILVIPSRSYQHADANPNLIAQQLKLILHGSIYAIYKNTITLLLTRSKDDGISEYEFSRLSEFLSANNLTAGLSNVFTDLGDSKVFYLQALKSAELGLKINPSTAIYPYSDYYIYHMLEICSKEKDLRLFIYPGIMKLLQYDKDNNTDFLDTLYEYLKTPGQTSNISDRLHVHKNTLIYRINRIQSIIGCDITDGDKMLALRLSIEVMKYLNII